MATRAQGSPMHDRHGKQRPSLVRSGPPPIPSGISPVLSRPQARTTDPPLTEPRAPPPKPRAPHFQLGTATALGLARHTKSPTHEVLWAATGPKWLAPEPHPPGARLEISGKPLGTSDTPLTSGDVPLKTADAPLKTLGVRWFLACGQRAQGRAQGSWPPGRLLAAWPVPQWQPQRQPQR